MIDLYNRYHTKPLTNCVRSVLSEGVFPIKDSNKWEQFLEDTKENDRVLAVLEFPALDIELEMWTGDGYNDFQTADDSDNDIFLCYVVCAKTDRGWEMQGTLSEECTVDFNSDKWENDLRHEMHHLLKTYAKENDLSLSEPVNF